MTERVRATLGDWQMVQINDKMYLRRPGYRDTMFPYSEDFTEVCVRTAIQKYGWTEVIEDTRGG